MKKLLITGLLTINLLFMSACGAQTSMIPSLKIIVEAKDENGEPVPMVNVVMAGSTSTPGSRREAFGDTDANGRFSAIIATMDGNVKVRSFFTKGYYKCGNEVTVGQKTPNDLSMLKTGKWSDDEQIVPLLMRPINNPVPMKVKKVTESIPIKNEWVGYDLETGDWVMPHGKGQVADIELYSEGTVESTVEYNGKTTMRFPGFGNGIQSIDLLRGYQRCEFQSPYEAPEDGYFRQWEWNDIRRTKGLQFSEITDESFPSRMFVFRIRTEMDNYGRVIRAMYGKIYGPVHFGVRGSDNKGTRGSINLTYYLNPDYTRNLEYDPKQNLFTQPRHGATTFPP